MDKGMPPFTKTLLIMIRKYIFYYFSNGFHRGGENLNSTSKVSWRTVEKIDKSFHCFTNP
jgi:hypothetical protein